MSALLLDIEGTTTPIAFVYDTLFPYARERVSRFLEQRRGDPGVEEDVALLRREHATDAAAGLRPPPWTETPEAVAAYAHWLMDQERPPAPGAVGAEAARAPRKSTGLKALQGRIWQEGYRRGELRSVVFEDVPRAFERWRAQARRIAIFSSGSVLAQKLLFAHTEHGDLTAFVDGWFDTTTGPKREPRSYAAIAASLAVPASEILFVSDVTAELDAARSAGLATRLSLRGVDREDGRHPALQSFDEIG